MIRSPFTSGLDLDLESIRFLFSFVFSFSYRVSISFVSLEYLCNFMFINLPLAFVCSDLAP